MIERDKEYYNQKISELYAVIESQEKIIRDLQEENQTLKNHCQDTYDTGQYLIEKQKERINKAIEYIRAMTKLSIDDYTKKYLLEILKGGNDE